MPFDGYKIQIVDFSNDYFRQRRDGMPEEREGKFVLMRDNGRKMEYLVLSPSEQCTYHAEIVERFCRRFRIRVSKTVRPRRFVIEDPNWEVAGGGRWNWHGGEKRLLLHGESLQYGPCDLDVIWERLSKVPEIADWQILIDQ